MKPFIYLLMMFTIYKGLEFEKYEKEMKIDASAVEPFQYWRIPYANNVIPEQDSLPEKPPL